MDYEALKAEINAKCTQAQIETRNCEMLAGVVSVGRMAPNTKEIGNGTILEVLGIVAGNKLLDEIHNNTNYRYVQPLVEQGRLIIGSELVQMTLQAMVPSVVSQAEADKLKAVGFSPSTVTAYDVSVALYNPDGSIK